MLRPQAPDVRQVLRSFHEKTGIRVLFTLPCYKDASQSTVAGLEATTLRYAAEYHNASWLAFYDLCNEPDDQPGYFPAIRLNSSNTTLGDLHPRWKEFYNWQKWLCGGWSTTFDVRLPIPVTSPPCYPHCITATRVEQDCVHSHDFGHTYVPTCIVRLIPAPAPPSVRVRFSSTVQIVPKPQVPREQHNAT